MRYASREIVAWLTLKDRAISACTSPLASRALRDFEPADVRVGSSRRFRSCFGLDLFPLHPKNRTCAPTS